ARQRGHREAVEHLADVAPEHRDERWLAAAAAATGGVLAETPLELRLDLQESYEKTFPQLLAAAPYLAVRDDLALPAFDRCLAEAACGAHLNSYVERHRSAATTLALGKLAHRHGVLDAALQLFRREAHAESVCGDRDVANAAMENLGSVDGLELASACWRALLPRLRAYAADPRAFGRQRVCELLVRVGEPGCAPRPGRPALLSR
ncbi:MAG: hypothetical protein KIT31_40670, partial [Deltaproteobacteria bacterium]|nr:hypothetical protein [Deltaproteobacteria bacterium]